MSSMDLDYQAEQDARDAREDARYESACERRDALRAEGPDPDPDPPPRRRKGRGWLAAGEYRRPIR